MSELASERRADFRAAHQMALETLVLALAHPLPRGDHQAAQASVDSLANAAVPYGALVALEVVEPGGRVVADLDPRRFNIR